MLSKSFYEASTLLPNQIRAQQQQKPQPYISMSLMTQMQKFSIKYWQTDFNIILKRVYAMIKFTPGCKNGSIYANQ
jgi:hypothetical protein